MEKHPYIYSSIFMDGEWYAMCIPYLSQFNRLFKYLSTPGKEQLMLKFTGPLLTHRESASFPASFNAASPAGDCTVGMLNSDRQTFQTSFGEAMVYLQPCLIPVKDDNTGFDPISEINVPTGSIVRGGALLKNGNPIHYIPVSLSNDRLQLTIEDGDDLEFLAFEGMLWCTRPILYGSLQCIENTFNWHYKEKITQKEY